MIAVPSRQSIRAHIVVLKGGGASSFADLQGKDLGVAKRTEEQCRLFVDSECRSGGAERAGNFFARVVRPANIEAALDELCDGKVHATVVDTNGLEFYKDLKPGKFARLTVLTQSAPFPPLVVACKKGALDAMTREQIRAGLSAAKTTEAGREMLKMWKLTSFEPVPADFDQLLNRSLEAYPLADARK
jgi:ABC-type phosphate/phosphonate transport system substrate-binding protein